ncbi:MAG TPA: hypothetical protein VGG64_11570 [Pirellulales bacterium]
MSAHRLAITPARLAATTAMLCAIGLFVMTPRSTVAQATAPAQGAASKGTATSGGAKAKSAAAATPAHAEDSAARDRILNSAPWKQMLQSFEVWLDSQTLYDPQQVKQIRARLAAGISRMTSGQLQWFLTDMEAKMEILNSPRAHDAQDYLAQTLAVASPAYARKIRDRVPDVLTSTAAQLNQRLSAFAAKQHSTIDMQKTFEDARQQQIATNAAQLASQQQESERALDRAQASAASSGSKSNNFTPARDYFPNAGNDGPFGPGTSIGFWGGGFF